MLSGFVQTVKNCFPGLSRTCKDQIPGFSRTHKTRFQALSRINSVHKHRCIRSKTCTYQISYRCNCITVTVFLKFKLTQKVTNCTQHFTMNASLVSNTCTRNFQDHYFRIPGLFQGFPGPMSFSRTFQARKLNILIPGLSRVCTNPVLYAIAMEQIIIHLPRYPFCL